MKPTIRRSLHALLTVFSLVFAAFIFVNGKDKSAFPELKNRTGALANDPEWFLESTWPRESKKSSFAMKRILILPDLVTRYWQSPIKAALLLFFLTLALESHAHTLNYELASLSQTNLAWNYFKLGFEHIVLLGVDHILFVLSIFFLSNR